MYILDRKCKVDGIINEIPTGAINLIMSIRVNSALYSIKNNLPVKNMGLKYRDNPTTFHLSLFSHTKKEQIKAVRGKF